MNTGRLLPPKKMNVVLKSVSKLASLRCSSEAINYASSILYATVEERKGSILVLHIF